MADYEKLKSALVAHGHEHLLQFWDGLNEQEKKSLASDIADVNFAEVNSYFARATQNLQTESAKLDDKLEPIPHSQYESVQDTSREKLSEYEGIGLQEIGKGTVGVLLMAGGQGTRLGSTNPKGMYDVGLPSHKTLFQIQAERILCLQRLAEEKTGLKGSILWYIMTSESTMEPTYEFLEKNNFFGLLKENVYLFEQGSLPCYQFDGKLILDSKFKISSAPDGNGGLYRALRERKVLEHMRLRGIKHLHAHSVDNILVKVADPVFVGYCVSKNSDCAAKVVEKSSPNEAVGVVCRVDGSYRVVEYSEITQETAERRNEDGKLTFNAGNICNHYFTLDFLDRVSTADLELHVAKKKIPYVDERGVRLTPDKANGIKIEKFVFDVFQFAENFTVLEVSRHVEFSALKNADSAGKDCASTARRDIFRLHREYLRDAGADIDDAVECEISPSLSYAGEGLERIAKSLKFTNSPIYLHSAEQLLEKCEAVITNGKH